MLLERVRHRLSSLSARFFVRLLAGVLIVALPVMGLIVAVLTTTSGKSLADATSVSVGNLADTAASRVGAWVVESQNLLDGIGGTIASPALDFNLERATALLAAQPSDPFEVLEITDTTGRTVSSSNPSATVDVSGAGWMHQVAATPVAPGNTVVTPIVRAGTHLIWAVARPVGTGDGKFAGLLVGILNPTDLATLLYDPDGSKSSLNEIQAVGADHLLIYSSRMSALTDSSMIQQGALTLSVRTPAADGGLGGQSGTARYGDVIVGYASVRSLGWAITVAEDANLALASVNFQRNLGIGVLLAGALLLTLMTVFFARRTTRPIAALSAAARSVTAGNLEARVEPCGSIEVSSLGQAFNAMVERLGRLVARIQGVSQDLAESAAQLSAASSQLASATTQQSSAVTQTSTSMEELAATSASIADTVEKVAAQAGETRNNLENARIDIRASRERTLALSHRVEEITAILTQINDIADQTNLLALNAAIEAARAGQAGRGFAVVADEVRRLADRARTLAGEIALIIEIARGETSATVMAMDKGASQLQVSLTLMEQVAEASSHVRLATQHQRSATAQVLDAMEQVNIGSRQVAITAQEIASAAGGQAVMAHDLKGSVGVHGEHRATTAISGHRAEQHSDDEGHARLVSGHGSEAEQGW